MLPAATDRLSGRRDVHDELSKHPAGASGAPRSTGERGGAAAPPGPVVLEERADGIRLIRVRSLDEAAPYRASFAGAYQAIFAEPPYQERFFPSEAQAILRAAIETPGNITVLAVRGLTQVVGFGLGLPAAHRGDVKRELRGLLGINQTYYLAELGVLPAWRGAGLGKALVRHRLRLVDRRVYTNVLLRTSAARTASYEMYVGLGFEDMGVYMEVPSRRVDGTVKTDRRLFLCKVVPRCEDVGEEVSDPETWLPEEL